MNPASIVRPVDGASHTKTRSFLGDVDIILSLRLVTIGLLIASTTLHFNGDNYTPVLNVLAVVLLLNLVWNLVLVLMTGRFPRLWQSKQQDGDEEHPTSYQPLGPISDAWLSIILLIFTIWTKTIPDPWQNIQYKYNFNVMFPINIIVFVFMHAIAILEHIKVDYPKKYERLNIGSHSHVRLP
ncbi:hypothetical protein PG985_004324 [Apiospora marii]|uniref:uncharacterized protein n=1 Tax=Apiospora marii TaxID=335849 RepID=UPI0031304796